MLAVYFQITSIKKLEYISLKKVSTSPMPLSSKYYYTLCLFQETHDILFVPKHYLGAYELRGY